MSLSIILMLKVKIVWVYLVAMLEWGFALSELHISTIMQVNRLLMFCQFMHVEKSFNMGDTNNK